MILMSISPFYPVGYGRHLKRARRRNTPKGYDTKGGDELSKLQTHSTRLRVYVALCSCTINKTGSDRYDIHQQRVN